MSQRIRAREYAQIQARTAWQWVTEAENELGKDQDRYATLARKLPSYLQVSGLGQTMAFLYSKSKAKSKAKSKDDPSSPDGLLCRQLSEHLCKSAGEKRRRDRDRSGPLERAMDWIVNLKPDQYRQATREAMVMAEWVKRFAAGRLGEGNGD